MRLTAALLGDSRRLERARAALDRHAAVTACDSWAALAACCARLGASLILLDLFAVGGVSTEAVFDEVRELRRRHAPATMMLYMDGPSLRGSDLFDAGRLGLDGLVVAGVDDSPTQFGKAVADADARGVARVLRPELAGVPPVPRDALAVCVSRAHRALSPDELAAVIGIHRRRLAHELEEVGFPSPRRLIGWGRLMLAGRLLEDADRPANEVARALGFTSGGGFRNVCQRYLGAAPHEIRERGGVAYVISRFLARQQSTLTRRE